MTTAAANAMVPEMYEIPVGCHLSSCYRANTNVNIRKMLIYAQLVLCRIIRSTGWKDWIIRLCN
jgi:hypothetical protein